MKVEGWLLDVYIENGNTFLWVKTDDGVVKLSEGFNPDFYFLPSCEASQLIDTISEHVNIIKASTERKYVSLKMEREVETVHVWIDSTWNLKRVTRDLKKLKLVKDFYNTDLLNVQRYLFSKGVAPSNRVKVELKEGLRVKVLNDGYRVKPPPFTDLKFKLKTNSEQGRGNLKIREIEIYSCKNLRGEEEEILSNFLELIEERDPDFLVSPKITRDIEIIMDRSEEEGLNLSLGRGEPEGKPLHYIRGRVLVNLDRYEGMGLAGLCEYTNFSLLPFNLASKWPIGRLIDSRQCYEAYKANVLIPEKGSRSNGCFSLEQILFRDKGGLIFSPITGLHENVAELDFESMFPNIIVKFNVSYETVEPYRVLTREKGFLPRLTEKFLQRRLHYKHLMKKLSKGSLERNWCEQRQEALKMILVAIYGYSGCDLNRFGNIVVYQLINNYSRKILVKAMNKCLKEGFKVIYGDTDSVFIEGEGTTENKYKELAGEIAKLTGLPIKLKNHYRFLVLLPQEADPETEASRKYYGKLMNGELYIRGIELRRKGYPLYIKRFQRELIELLLKADSKKQVESNVRKAINYVFKKINEVKSGKVPVEELILTRGLRKNVTSYRYMLPHVSAAMQLEMHGRRKKEVSFIYTCANHFDPLRRIKEASLIKDTSHDKRKYIEMVVEAAETILSPFKVKKENLIFNRGKTLQIN